MFKSLIRVLIVALISIPIMLACGGDETEKSPVSISKEPSKPKVYDAPPAMIIDTKKDYSAVFEMDKGDEFEIDLYEKLTRRP